MKQRMLGDLAVSTVGLGCMGLSHAYGAALPCGTPESMRKSLEGSLKRMRLDAIDLYYLHKENPNMEPEVIAELMQTFIKEGKIRHWGLSNTSPDYIRSANAVCKLTAVQERYSMMARWNERLFLLLEELHIGFVAGRFYENFGIERQSAQERKYGEIGALL